LDEIKDATKSSIHARGSMTDDSAMLTIATQNKRNKKVQEAVLAIMMLLKLLPKRCETNQYMNTIMVVRIVSQIPQMLKTLQLIGATPGTLNKNSRVAGITKTK
jgi:hypothetical protein